MSSFQSNPGTDGPTKIFSSGRVRTMANRDGAILLEIKSGLMFSLNPVASQIWQMLNDGSTKREIVSRLIDDFQITAERASADVEEFIGQLETHQLTDAGDDPNSARGLSRFLSLFKHHKRSA